MRIITMKCPHCLVAFSDRPNSLGVGKDVDGQWNLLVYGCPECKRLILYLETDDTPVQLLENAEKGFWPQSGSWPIENPKTIMVRPVSSSRDPCPPEVPEDIKKDYVEACLVLPYSANACAALSRRCLQHILRKHANVKPDELNSEINEVLSQGNLPLDIKSVIRGPQIAGNIAAHPMPDNAGEITDVEPWEAEWVLDIIESLFGHYFVQPAKNKSRMSALKAKYDEGRANVK